MGRQPSAKQSEGDTAHVAPGYAIAGSAWRVADMPERLRPREEMARMGVRNVSDDVLLAIILRSGVRGANVVELSRSLLREFGSLTALAAASPEDVSRVTGLGPVKAQVLGAALELGRRLNEESVPKQHTVRTPEDAARLVRDEARTLDIEVFSVLLLDAKNHLKRRVEVSTGLLDASLAHPREVFREAVRSAAAAVVLVHNHPSGDAAPSAEDIRITRQLVAAGRVIDLRVLDHVIVAGGGQVGMYSMREGGVVDFA